MYVKPEEGTSFNSFEASLFWPFKGIPHVSVYYSKCSSESCGYGNKPVSFQGKGVGLTNMAYIRGGTPYRASGLSKCKEICQCAL